MKISTKGRYGLRLMLELAANYTKGNIPLKYISQKQNISDKYLEQIINSLGKAGLVKSARGSQGGYRLAYPPEKISVGSILRTLEGSLSPVPCLDGENECEKRNSCLTLPLWEELNDAIKNVVDQKSLSDLLKDMPDNGDDYCI